MRPAGTVQVLSNKSSSPHRASIVSLVLALTIIPLLAEQFVTAREVESSRAGLLARAQRGLDALSPRYESALGLAQVDAGLGGKTGANINVRVRVTNAGTMAGDEVVQLYVKDVQASVPVPLRALQGFKRIHLRPGQSQVVSFTLTPRQLSVIDNQFKRIVEPGEFEITVGGAQPGTVPASTQVLVAKVTLTGAAFTVK